MEISTQLVQKILVRFAKLGPAIYHSHHDMIRFWERAVKRARLPIRLTQGFNPRPRMVFPHALGLGIASRHEAVVLELHDRLPLAELPERIQHACGDTLTILGVDDLPPVKKSLQITASSYRITGWPAGSAQALADAASAILAKESIVVERGAPGDKRQVEIRPYLHRIETQGDALLVDLIHTPTGSARPDEVSTLAAATVGIDPRDLAIEKTGMHLE